MSSSEIPLVTDNEAVSLMAFIAETLDMPTSAVDLDTNLLDSGRLDSLAIVSLVSFLDGEMGVKLAVDQLVPANFASARQIIALARAVRHQSPDGRAHALG